MGLSEVGAVEGSGNESAVAITKRFIKSVRRSRNSETRMLI